MGCITSKTLNPDIRVNMPKSILQLSYKSDLSLLINVEDVMTMSYCGTTETSPEGPLAWCFNPEGNVDNDYSKPLLENPSRSRIEFCRFIIRFAMAISLRHNSVFVLVREDNDGKLTNEVLAATCCVPPNDKRRHEPGIWDILCMSLRSGIDFLSFPGDISSGSRMEALESAMKVCHKQWAYDRHWYVCTFATNYLKQGMGYGRKLMEFVCRMADAAKINLYIEVHGRKNQIFCEKNGYQVKEAISIEVKDSIPLEMYGGMLIMLRTPKFDNPSLPQ